MDYYGKSKELSLAFQKCLRTYSDMMGKVDSSKKSTYGFVPGLFRTAAAKDLDGQIEKLQEGIFQVLFTGGFSAGKSTLLNALMRKEVLRMNINAETAVITKIIFDRPETVLIVSKTIDKKTNQPQITEMTLKQFFEEYRVDQDNPEKFTSTEYVVIHQPDNGIGGSLVQLVDSPGTENSHADTLVAREFAKNASAIVHLINSTAAFQLEDKEYIKTHYAGRHMKNIFFVCNLFDCLNEDAQEELKASVRQQLKDVFTDENGKFDEELYIKRVFYTDSYHSLYARLGKSVKSPFGIINCNDSVTGVPEFEAALSQYLNAEDRDKEAFRGYIPQLAGRYVEALEAIKEILERFKEGATKLENKKSDLDGKLTRLKSIIDQIEQSCSTCVSGILNSARNKYYSCVGAINAGWDKHFSEVDISFGIVDMARLAWHNGNDAQVREITKPLADEVQSYVKDKIENMLIELSDDIEAHLKTLDEQLNIQQQQLNDLELPISVDSLRQSLLATLKIKNPSIDTGKMNGASLFQIILGIVGFAPDIILEGMDGKTTNFQAITKFLVKNVFEYIALYVVAWPLGIAMIIARIWNIIRNMRGAGTTRAQEILLSMKSKTVEAIQAQQDIYIMELEVKLSELTKAGKTATDSLNAQVNDYSSSLESTIEQLRSEESSEEAETTRTGKIRETLLKSLKSVNKLLNGSELTEDMIRQLAVRTN